MKAFDPEAALAHLRAADPVLAELIGRVGAYAPRRSAAKTLFEALFRAIVYQQLHGKAAESIHARAAAALRPYGGTTPEALARCPDGKLLGSGGAGLSRAKLAAARDLAAKCLDGTVPLLAEARKWGDDELVGRLTRVKGIGPWTVHMLLIFHLRRPDVLPTGDYAVRLAFRKLYRKRKDPTPAALQKHARRWHPYRSVASWYLWRSFDVATPE